MIRKAILSDIPRLQEIRSAVRENILSDPSKVTKEDYIFFIQNGPVWVHETDGLMTGFSASDPRDGTIWALFVDPAFEGRGIGKALFEKACDSLYTSGHKTARLYTQSDSRAEAFYRAAGWTAEGDDGKGNTLFTSLLQHPPHP